MFFRQITEFFVVWVTDLIQIYKQAIVRMYTLFAFFTLVDIVLYGLFACREKKPFGPHIHFLF